MPKTKNATKKVTAEQFVQLWEASASLDEVAQRTGLSKSNVATRAGTYRRAGIPLKRFPRGRKLDVDRLTQLVHETRNQTENTEQST